MRVLMTTDVVGGVWTFGQELTSGLLEEGCCVALFAVGGAANRDQTAWHLSLAKRWGNKFYFMSVATPLEWTQENGSAFTEAAPHLLSLAEAFQPDIFHSNQFCFGALPLSIPKVITAHSDVLSWATQCLEVPLEGSEWLRQYCSLVCAGLKAAAVVVTPTRWMQDALGEHFESPARQVVIANGRSTGKTLRRKRKLQSITAGRLWDKAKNIGLLLSVRSPIPIFIVGERSYEQNSAPAPKWGETKFLASFSPDKLLLLLCESAIYICPSKYEPFGLAPLEAALCGCAVVANDIPSLREVWGEGALYFSNADDLTHILDLLHASQELLAAAQRRSRKRAERYTRKAMVCEYLALYRKLVTETRDVSYVA